MVSFALDLVAFLASVEAARVECVFDVEAGLQGTEVYLAASRPKLITLGADKAYDAEDFVSELRSMNATPHVAQNTNGRSSAIDGRTTRHAGYALSQRVRKRIEEAFGWVKMIASQERSKRRVHERVRWALTFASATYDLARLRKLLEAAERSGELPLADRRG